MSSRVGAAVLAAGGSRRLRRPKQLAVVRGMPLVRRAVLAAQGSRCAATAVVVGARADDVRRAVSDLDPVVVHNDAWEEGIGASIRVAARWADAQAFDALVVAVCDQPRLEAATLDALVDAFARRRAIVASVYAGVRGVPALFPASSFASLAGLRGDRGARSLLRDALDVVEVAWEDGAVDVDTPDDLARATG